MYVCMYVCMFAGVLASRKPDDANRRAGTAETHSASHAALLCRDGCVIIFRMRREIVAGSLSLSGM
jgi:hypothetical protein